MPWDTEHNVGIQRHTCYGSYIKWVASMQSIAAKAWTTIAIAYSWDTIFNTGICIIRHYSDRTSVFGILQVQLHKTKLNSKFDYII